LRPTDSASRRSKPWSGPPSTGGARSPAPRSAPSSRPPHIRPGVPRRHKGSAGPGTTAAGTGC
jgi:hypothetical protein